MSETLIAKPEITAAYNARPQSHRGRLLELRELILKNADKIEAIKEIDECLKWGQPSFVVKPDKVGSTIRVDKHDENSVAAYFICNTTLVEEFRQLYPYTFQFGGNRALIFDLDQELPKDELSHCIGVALTYHLNKRKTKAR